MSYVILYCTHLLHVVLEIKLLRLLKLMNIHTEFVRHIDGVSHSIYVVDIVACTVI